MKLYDVAKRLSRVPDRMGDILLTLGLSPPEEAAFVIGLFHANYPGILAKHLRQSENIAAAFQQIASDQTKPPEGQNAKTGSEALEEFLNALSRHAASMQGDGASAESASNELERALLGAELGLIEESDAINAVLEVVIGSPSAAPCVPVSGKPEDAQAGGTSDAIDPLQAIFGTPTRTLEQIPDDPAPQSTAVDKEAADNPASKDAAASTGSKEKPSSGVPTFKPCSGGKSQSVDNVDREKIREATTLLRKILRTRAGEMDDTILTTLNEVEKLANAKPKDTKAIDGHGAIENG